MACGLIAAMGQVVLALLGIEALEERADGVPELLARSGRSLA